MLDVNSPELVYVSGRTRPAGEINGKSGNLNNALNLIYPPGVDIPLDEVRAAATCAWGGWHLRRTRCTSSAPPVHCLSGRVLMPAGAVLTCQRGLEGISIRCHHKHDAHDVDTVVRFAGGGGIRRRPSGQGGLLRAHTSGVWCVETEAHMLISL